MRINVTVVGPTRVYPKKKDIKESDELTFKKVFSSDFGKTVEVYNKRGDQVGFVAASNRTAEVGTYLADEIFDNSKIPEELNGIVKKRIETGTKLVFITELLTTEAQTEEKKEEDKMDKELQRGRKFITGVVGSKRIYPHRYHPSKAVKAGEEVPAQLDVDEKNEIINVNIEVGGAWQPCGCIATENLQEDSDFKTYSDIIKILNMYRTQDGELPEMEAKLTGLNTSHSKSLFYVLELTVYGQTAIEQLTEGFSGEGFEEMKTFVESINVSEKVAVECFKLLQNSLPQDFSRIPGATTFNNYDEVVEDVIYSIISKGNTMLSGPMAAGKNTLLEMLANVFQKGLYEIQVNSMIDNDILLGTRTIKAKSSAQNKDAINEECRKLYNSILSKDLQLKEALKNADKESQLDIVSGLKDSTNVDIDFSIILDAIKSEETEIDFLPSALVVAMEKGSWVVLDEFNTGQASVMSVLNSVLDDRKRIQVPGYGLVQAAPGFRLFATMNPEYEGTFTLNPATASRFSFVLFKASDKIAPIILTRVPSSTHDFLNTCEKIYKKIRDGIESGKLQEDSINIRGFIEAAKMVELGRPQKRALLTCVANGISDMDDRNAIRSYIEIEVA